MWLLLLSGCDSNPLDGAWKTSSVVSEVTLENTLDLRSDATVTITVEPTKPPPGVTCTGSLRSTGETWTSEESTTPSEGRITISGTVECASDLRCVGGGVTLGCGQLQGDQEFVCDYKLSDHDDKLELFRCTGEPSGHTTLYVRTQ